MKTWMGVLGLFGFTVSVFAIPSVGDIARYHAVQVKNGIKVMEQNTEYKFVAFDRATDEFTQVQTTQSLMPAGQPPEVVTTQVKRDSALSDAQIDQMLQMCAQIGGKLEKIRVPAGAFDTCKLPQETQSVWIAKVPFGFVKMTQTDSNGEMTAELTSFVRGQ